MFVVVEHPHIGVIVQCLAERRDGAVAVAGQFDRFAVVQNRGFHDGVAVDLAHQFVLDQCEPAPASAGSAGIRR